MQTFRCLLLVEYRYHIVKQWPTFTALIAPSLDLHRLEFGDISQWLNNPSTGGLEVENSGEQTREHIYNRHVSLYNEDIPSYANGSHLE